MTAGSIVLWEGLGTAVLILLGVGVVANVVLRPTLGTGGGWLMITFGWGFAVFAGASIAEPSGAHLNPAVTIGLAVAGATQWSMVPFYLIGQLVGAFVGATVGWLAYKANFDKNVEEDPEGNRDTRGIFCTGPVVARSGWNVITEVVATFVLVFWILSNPAAQAPDGAGVPQFGNGALGYAAVAFVVIGIGCSLGGPTGYAINPARDLGPRLAYAVLPIRGKGSPEWGYAWVPIVGPIIGAVLAGLLSAGVS
ncbi:MIP/aquaporin family protein [Pseudonocardia halophobica]|uniref:MIP/aquaporin family protein n=1 Tax=Pseudonocardia halophobica TaxID=29401 RepID=UPI00055F3C34|nr:MIP/aquaporin family protein [Pseudonocardia halophobica]